MKNFTLLFFLFCIYNVSAEPDTKAPTADAVQEPAPAKDAKEKPTPQNAPLPPKISAETAEQTATQAKTEKKTDTQKTPPLKAKKTNTRRVTQFSNVDLNQSVNSLSVLLNELPALCQNSGALAQKVKKFQQKMTVIKQTIRQIKEDFVINNPALHSYINTLDFYLNESKQFNYEKKIPSHIKELKEYVSGLALSFQYMYQMAFNIPDDTPLNELPKGWGRSIGTTLHCLENHK